MRHDPRLAVGPFRRLGRGLSYHPLFWVVPFGVLVFFLRKRLPRRLVTVLAWAAGIAFVAVYAVRLADPEDTVVVFAPETGLLHRILRLLPLRK